MFDFSFERFTPHQKKAVFKFFSDLSIDSRIMLSISGIDPEGIYHSFREGWKENLCVCLYKKDKVVGVGKLSPWKGGVYLSCLVVSDTFQRTGLGSKIVKYLMACAMMNGGSKIYLETRKDNNIGLRFFQSLGFRLMKETELCYLMERSL